MININDREIRDRQIQIVLDENDLEQAFRNVLSEIIAEKAKENNCARISRAAACKRLGKTPSSLYRWEQAAKLHPIKIGRSTYYMEREIIDIEEGRV